MTSRSVNSGPVENPNHRTIYLGLVLVHGEVIIVLHERQLVLEGGIVFLLLGLRLLGQPGATRTPAFLRHGAQSLKYIEGSTSHGSGSLNQDDNSVRSFGQPQIPGSKFWRTLLGWAQGRRGLKLMKNNSSLVSTSQTIPHQ